LSDSERRVLVERDGRITRITMARPSKLNAMDGPMLIELLEAFDAVRRDKRTNVVVVTGQGRAFSTGVDLRVPLTVYDREGVQAVGYEPLLPVLDEEAEPAFGPLHMMQVMSELIRAVERVPQPTIAVINGPAIGGAGVGLAMACDMRFAVESARFRLMAVEIDSVQDHAATFLLQRAIGVARTMEMALSGEWVDAVEAERWGMVNRVFSSLEELTSHVNGLVAGMASRSPDTLPLYKHVIRHGERGSFEDQLALEAVTAALTLQSQAALTRMRAFKDERGIS
jgi:enoyl-CoA hydratase/carnithine racemase